MTLRQEYARPRPRAIARHTDQLGRAAAPAPTGPPGSAHRVSRASARSCRSNPSQLRAGCVHWRAQTQSPCAARRAAGWTPAAWLRKARPLPPFLAARARRGDLPLQSAPAARPAESLSGGLLPQVVGDSAASCGCPVGVLQAVLCGGPSRRP